MKNADKKKKRQKPYPNQKQKEYVPFFPIGFDLIVECACVDEEKKKKKKKK
jgi:hypothetical protein